MKICKEFNTEYIGMAIGFYPKMAIFIHPGVRFENRLGR